MIAIAKWSLPPWFCAKTFRSTTVGLSCNALALLDFITTIVSCWDVQVDGDTTMALFCWDGSFASYQLSLDNLDLALSNLIQIVSKKPDSFFGVFLCLSRACLDKMMHFIH